MGTAPPRILASAGDPEQLADVVSLACSLAGDDRHAEVHVLHVVLIPRALPLDADMKEEVAFGESLLAKAEEVQPDIVLLEPSGTAEPGARVLVNGADDRLFRRDEGAFLAATRDGVLRVVDGAGHVPSVERPDEFDEALRRFLDSIRW